MPRVESNTRWTTAVNAPPIPAPADSSALRVQLPGGVRLALAMLWIAWSMSVCAFVAHLYRTRGSGADLYAVIGAPAALIQALLIYLLSRRNNLVRVTVLLLAIPAFIVAVVFFPPQVSSLRLVVESLLRGAALGLLLTPGATQWYKQAQLPTPGPHC